MIYVVASHQGFVQWTADHRGKDAIHISRVDTARAYKPAANDEIHFAYGGDSEAYDILCQNRRMMS